MIVCVCVCVCASATCLQITVVVGQWVGVEGVSHILIRRLRQECPGVAPQSRQVLREVTGLKPCLGVIVHVSVCATACLWLNLWTTNAELLTAII